MTIIDTGRQRENIISAHLLEGEDCGVAPLPSHTSSILFKTLLMKPALDITFSLAERLLMVDSGCGRETRKKNERTSSHLISWCGGNMLSINKSRAPLHPPHLLCVWRVDAGRVWLAPWQVFSELWAELCRTGPVSSSWCCTVLWVLGLSHSRKWLEGTCRNKQKEAKTALSGNILCKYSCCEKTCKRNKVKVDLWTGWWDTSNIPLGSFWGCDWAAGQECSWPAEDNEPSRVLYCGDPLCLEETSRNIPGRKTKKVQAPVESRNKNESSLTLQIMDFQMDKKKPMNVLTLFNASYLFAETQWQFEQLLDEVQFLAALIQETQQLAHVEARGVLPD